MSGSFYYTTFSFKATGLSQILSEFKSAAAQIDAQAASIGKLNFTGMNAALPVLRNIDNTLLLMAEHTNLLSSSGAKLGNVFTPMSAGATKASTATKSVTTSMTQLRAVSGQVSSATTKVTSSMSALGAAGKAALGGIVSSGERAIATMSGLSAAMMSVGRSAARMGTLAAIPMAGMRGLSGAVTGSLLASSAAMLLNPFNAAPLTVGYGIYSGMNLQKAGSMAAGKSGASGLQAKEIQQIVWDSAQSFMGQYAYTPNQIGEMQVAYAAMGGNLTDLTTTKGVTKNALDFAQAVNMELAPAMELLYSQALNWAGFQTMQGPGAAKAIQNQADALTVLSNQTRLNPEDLGSALKASTAVASVSGMSQEQLYATVGALSQLGRAPSQADSDVRRLLLRLTPSYNALQQQQADELGLWVDAEGKQKDLSALNEGLKQIGLTYKDISLEANNGDLLASITKVTDAMNAKGWDQLTQESFLKTYLGLQGTTPFYLLGQQSGKDIYTDLLDKLKNKEGVAATGAKTQLDELWGSFGKLKSNIVGTANNIGEYFIPSTKRMVDFVNASVIPQLNNLGSALASGDWKGVADIVGSSLDFLGEKFLDSDETLTSWINNGIDGLDEFSQRFLDFTSGGGVGDLFGNLGQWAQNIWDGIDWGKVGDITSNLSTAFNAAWDQSVEWLRTSIDNIDWSNLGTRAGEALQDAGLWILNKIGDLPWSELTTAATNALTGIVLSIDWASAVSTIMRVGSEIGAALYNGVASSNLGILFQNWAIEFQNSMGMAIAGVAASLAGLAAQMGVPVATIQGAADTVIGTGEGIVKNLKQTNFEDIYKWGVYDLTHSTNTQGEYTGKGDFLYLNNGTLTLKNPFETVPAGSNSQSIFAEESIEVPTLSSDVGLPSFEEIRSRYPYLSGESVSRMKKMFDVLRTDQSAEGFYVTEEEARRTGTTANMCIQASSKALEALKAAGFGTYASLITNPSLAPGEQGHARVAIDPTGTFSPDTTFAIDTTPNRSGTDTDTFEGTFKEQMEHLVHPERLEWDFYKNPSYDISNPTSLLSNPDFSFTPSQVKHLSQVFTTELKDSITGEIIKSGQPFYYGVGPQGEVLRDKVYKTDTASLYLNIDDIKKLKFNSGAPITSVGGTIEDRSSGLGGSSLVGQSAVDATYKAASGETDSGSIEIPDRDHSKNHKKSSSSSSSSSETSSSKTSSKISPINTESILQGWLSYWNDPENKFEYEGSALETFFNNPEKSLGNSITTSTTKNAQAIDKQTSSTSQQTSVTDKQTSSTSQQTSATDQLTSATSSLTGEFAAFADLINSEDYEGISKLIKDKYVYDNPATKKDEREGVWTAEDWKNADARIEDSKKDIDSALSTYLAILKATQGQYIVPEVKEIAESTRKMAKFSDPMAVFKKIEDAFGDHTYETVRATESVTSAVQSESDRAATQAKVDSSLQQLLYSTICDIEGFFTPERVSPLGTFTSPTGGQLVRVADTWMTKDEYEATIGVPLWQQQANAMAKTGHVPFYGSITKEDMPEFMAWYDSLSKWAKENVDKAMPAYQAKTEEYLGNEAWNNYQGTSVLRLGGESNKPSISPVKLGLSDEETEIPITPVVNSDPIDSFKTSLADGTSFKVDVTAPNAGVIAGQLWGLGGSTTFTVYVNTVSRSYADNLVSANYGDVISTNLPDLQGTPNMDLGNIPDLVSSSDVHQQSVDDLIDPSDFREVTLSDIIKQHPIFSDEEKSLISKALSVIHSDQSNRGKYVGMSQSVEDLNLGIIKEIPEIHNCFTAATSLVKSFEDSGLGEYAEIAVTGKHAMVVFSPDKSFDPEKTLFFDTTPSVTGDNDDRYYGTYEDILRNKAFSPFFKKILNKENEIAIDEDYKDNYETIVKNSSGSYSSVERGVGKREIKKVFYTDFNFDPSDPEIKIKFERDDEDVPAGDLNLADFDINPVVNTEPIDSFKASLADGTSFKVDVTAPNAVAIAGQLWGLGGSTTFTVYVNTVSRSYADNLVSANYGDVISTNLPDLQGTPNMSLKDIPAFAEGGYTGNYEGGAIVHPHELILNEAQQRGVVSAMNSSGKSVSISIDARGAIITDRSMDTLVEKIKNALQSEGYR